MTTYANSEYAVQLLNSDHAWFTALAPVSLEYAKRRADERHARGWDLVRVIDETGEVVYQPKKWH